jgi:excisionase family DNA binding protein
VSEANHVVTRSALDGQAGDRTLGRREAPDRGNNTQEAEMSREELHSTTTTTDLPRLMSVEEVSEYLSIPVATLYRWRHQGTGPKASRVGRYLRYSTDDVRTWLYEGAA